MIVECFYGNPRNLYFFLYVIKWGMHDKFSANKRGG